MVHPFRIVLKHLKQDGLSNTATYDMDLTEENISEQLRGILARTKSVSVAMTYSEESDFKYACKRVLEVLRESDSKFTLLSKSRFLTK